MKVQEFLMFAERIVQCAWWGPSSAPDGAMEGRQSNTDWYGLVRMSTE